MCQEQPKAALNQKFLEAAVAHCSCVSITGLGSMNPEKKTKKTDTSMTVTSKHMAGSAYIMGIERLL